MSKNKFFATWISHSSISSFLNCERCYYLQNVYKTPDRRKIAIASPYMTMGSVLHGTIEPYSLLRPEERKTKMFSSEFHRLWKENSGEKGGFSSQEEEDSFKEKSINALRNVRENIHHLLNETVQIEEELPWLWLSEKEEIILCSKLDWIDKTENGFHILDFKSGQSDEKENSLQLNIYSLILNHYLGEGQISSAYWYIARDKDPIQKDVPDLTISRDKIMEVGLKIKEARAKKEFKCQYGGCFHCKPFEKILRGEAKFLGLGNYKQEIYKVDK